MKYIIPTNKCAATANSMCGLIRRTFSYLDKSMFLALYKTFIRPQFKYASSVWSAYPVHVITRGSPKESNKMVTNARSNTNRLKKLHRATYA